MMQRVAVLPLGWHIGILRRKLLQHFVPQHVGVPLGVALGRHRQLAAARAGQLKAVPQDPLHALAACAAAVCTATSSGVPRFSRPPLSTYSPSLFSRMTTKSMSAGLLARQHALHARIEPAGPHAGVLIERLADLSRAARA